MDENFKPISDVNPLNQMESLQEFAERIKNESGKDEIRETQEISDHDKYLKENVYRSPQVEVDLFRREVNEKTDEIPQKPSEYTTEATVEYNGFIHPGRIDVEKLKDVSEKNIAGDIRESIKCWHHQELPKSCAVASQAFVIRELKGIDVTEKELVKLAESKGWFDKESGTTMNDIGRLAEKYGLVSEQLSDLNLDEIEMRVGRGERLIAAVNAETLILKEYADDPLAPLYMKPNHAVEIIGVDRNDANNPKIIINDPGVEDGAGNVYEWTDFKKSFSPHGAYAVSIHL